MHARLNEFRSKLFKIFRKTFQDIEETQSRRIYKSHDELQRETTLKESFPSRNFFILSICTAHMNVHARLNEFKSILFKILRKTFQDIEEAQSGYLYKSHEELQRETTLKESVPSPYFLLYVVVL